MYNECAILIFAAHIRRSISGWVPVGTLTLFRVINASTLHEDALLAQRMHGYGSAFTCRRHHGILTASSMVSLIK
jgi:hypothetical protein